MSNQNDYGIILTLPGFDVDTATPEQCAVHSAYPNPLIKMGAEPKHFGTINVFFASNPGETDVDNPITYVARVPHGYPYAPNTLTIYSFIPLGETETVVGTFPFNASTPANDYFSFGADETHYGIAYTKFSNNPSDITGLSISFRYYIFADPAGA